MNYKAEDGRCTTVCPFNFKSNDGHVVNVGSYTCFERCSSFVYGDVSKKIVVCENEISAVFSDPDSVWDAYIENSYKNRENSLDSTINYSVCNV